MTAPPDSRDPSPTSSDQAKPDPAKQGYPAGGDAACESNATHCRLRYSAGYLAGVESQAATIATLRRRIAQSHQGENMEQYVIDRFKTKAGEVRNICAGAQVAHEAVLIDEAVLRDMLAICDAIAYPPDQT